jgi:hypothetical protein
MERMMLYLSIAGLVISVLALGVAVLAMVPDWLELIAELAKVQH